MDAVAPMTPSARSLLGVTRHRPWPLPQQPWALRQTWHDVLFAHWAVDPRTKYRWGVDHAIPLSDHADFDQLIEAVRIVAPREVYCTHGSEAFVDHLCDLGFNAFPLAPRRQKQLF